MTAQEEVTRAYEEQTEEESTSGLSTAIQAVLVALVRAWIRFQAGQGTTEEIRQEADKLRAIIPGVSEVLAPLAIQGVSSGLDIGGAPSGAELENARQKAPRALLEVVAGVDEAVAAKLDEAARLAVVLPMDTRGDVNLVMAKGRSAVNTARARARWAANYAVNAGITESARERGLRILWVAERNACLHCYAYAGRTVAPGEDFPLGLTYADRPLNGPPEGLPHPPLHPNCRCSLEVTDLLLDESLAREAARSVARGWSDYDSEPARLRAADRLVQNGATLPGAAPNALPRSVLDRARRDVAARTFSQRHRPRTGLNA